MKCPELELWGSKLEMWNSPGTAAFRLDNSSDSVVLPVGIPIILFYLEYYIFQFIVQGFLKVKLVTMN